MRNWNPLIDVICTLKEKPCVWPTLSPLGFSSEISIEEQKQLQKEYQEKFEKQLSEHNQISLNKLLEILLPMNISDEEKEKQLRCLLKTRGKFISNSSVDYTLNIGLPATYAFYMAAKLIKKPNENLCQLLMPTIKKILGTGFLPEDIGSASVDDHENFILHDFLINESGNALIHIKEIFERARKNPEILFSKVIAMNMHNAQTNESELCYRFTSPLTAIDRQRLRTIAGEASQVYFDTLEKINRIFQNQKPSLDFALKELSVALLKGSKVNHTAEMVANSSECYSAIIKFYQCWSTLPLDTKEIIINFRAENASDDIRESLESQLLCVFYSANIALSKEESDRVKSEDIVECAHQLGLQLDAIRNYHRKVLVNIPLPGMEEQFIYEALPSEEELNQLSKNLENALQTRAPFLGSEDDRLIKYHSYFQRVTKLNIESAIFKTQIELLAIEIETVADLTQAVLLLSKENLCHLFKPLQYRLKKMFSPDGKSWDAFAYLLTHVPADYWLTLCDALSIKTPHRLLTGNDLAILMDQFPESQWSALAEAMINLSGSVFLTYKDVHRFFNKTRLGSWKMMYDCFKQNIDDVFKNVDSLAMLFQESHTDDWLSYSQVLRLIIAQHLNTFNFISMTLSRLAGDRRILFVRAMTPFFATMDTNQYAVLVLKKFQPDLWAEVVFLLKNNCLLLHNESDLKNFLNQFEHVSDRIIFLQALLVLDPLFKADVNTFYQLLCCFPECQKLLLKLFIEQLPDMLSQLINTFSTNDSYGITIPEEMKKAFNCFLNQGLPILLSLDHIKRATPESVESFHLSADADRTNPVYQLYQQLESIEDEMLIKKLSAVAAIAKKLHCLVSFIKKCEKLNSQYQERNYQVNRMVFYNEINEAFGANFFEQIEKYRYRFQSRHIMSPSSAGFFVTQPMVLVDPPEIYSPREGRESPFLEMLDAPPAAPPPSRAPSPH